MRRTILGFTLAALAVLGYAGIAWGSITPTTNVQPQNGNLKPSPVVSVTRTGNFVTVWAGLNGMKPNQAGYVEVETYNGYSSTSGASQGNLQVAGKSYDPGGLIATHSAAINPGQMVVAASFELAAEPPSGTTLMVWIGGGNPDLGATPLTYVYRTPVERGGVPPEWNLDESTLLPGVVIPAPSSDGSPVTTTPVTVNPPVAAPVTAPVSTTTSTTKPVKTGSKVKLYTTVCKHYTFKVRRHGKTFKVGKWSCVRRQVIGRGKKRHSAWVTIKTPRHPQRYLSPGRVLKP
jgi:hypothetical protein